MWIANGRVVEKKFQDDFAEALKAYTTLTRVGKAGLTMRCCNVGIDPPKRLRPHHVQVKRKVRGRISYDLVSVIPMKKLNSQGVWWCPYCAKLRRFAKRKGFKFQGAFVPQDGMYCPICGISHFDGHVRKHNPHAQLMEFRQQRRTKSGKARRKRNRKRP